MTRIPFRARPSSIVLVLVLVAGAAAVLAGPTSDRVVLVGGEALTGLEAEVRDGLVWVTFEDGRRQAFTLEDVDLEASGLIDQPTEVASEEPQPRSRLGDVPTEISADTPPASTSAMVITDADVEHIEIDAETGEPANAESRLLVIAKLRMKTVGTKLNVTGMVSNRANMPATQVAVTIVALDNDGNPIGEAGTTLRQPLKAGHTAPFSLIIQGAGSADQLEGSADGVFPDGVQLAVPLTPEGQQNPHARSAGRSRED